MKKSFSSELKKDHSKLWNQVLNHPFNVELGNFTLPKEKFKTFIEQDYHYLIGFIKCLGLLVAKSEKERDLLDYKNLMNINIREIETLKKIYEKLDGSKEILESKKAFLATESYKSFLIRIGYEGSEFEILGAILPCDWIFADIGNKIIEEIPEVRKKHHQIYSKWIESYASENYQSDIEELRRKIDEKSKTVGQKDKNDFKKNFEYGIRLEHAFFESIYDNRKD